MLGKNFFTYTLYLYCQVEDFEDYDEELVTEWFIKIENDCEHVNNRYAQMIHIYEASYIGKLMNNYNPFGCEELYLLVYYVGKSFNSFWDMMIEEIIDYVGKKYEKVDATKDIMNSKYINSGAASIKISIENKTVYLYVMGIKT